MNTAFAQNRTGTDNAVSTLDSDRDYLDRWSNRLARVLLARGAAPGTRIAVAVDPAVEFVVTRWAIEKIGATVVSAESAYAVRLGVTTKDDRDGLTNGIDWLVLDDRSTLLGYLTGSDAPITDADLYHAHAC
ncbi:AMP-binding protein [Nocardia sp. XZ_19_385]|uniref:AMP-binding protein n=1 Tax=Nocardia sp. XZ_19_385 TaxID=2769488 RepID=UPI0018905F8A|nr:AMP-binding protein [Nocardia sp. XZ_19_385]